MKDDSKTSAGLSLAGSADKGAIPPSGAVPPRMGSSPLSDDRFRSSLCQAGKHDECEHSALIGICGCECHDWLDDLDQECYGGMN